MTVKELIEHLKECNQDLPVAICTDHFFGYYSVIEAEDVAADTVETESTPHKKFDAMVIRVY
jgi:hypothetical protein